MCFAGYQNNSDSGQSFDDQYARIKGIREHIDDGKEKCAATSTLIDSQYRRQAKAVNQNAQLNLDAITRKQQVSLLSHVKYSIYSLYSLYSSVIKVSDSLLPKMFRSIVYFPDCSKTTENSTKLSR